MNINITYKTNSRQRNTFRSVVLLFVVLCLSFGSLPSYFDCKNIEKMDLAEKSEVETEADEKENKEEIEKDEYVSKLMGYSSKVKLPSILGHGNDALSSEIDFLDIITPPPEHFRLRFI